MGDVWDRWGDRGLTSICAAIHEFVPTAVTVGAETMPSIGAGELPASPVDRLVVELMNRAKHGRDIQIVDGLTPDAITRAPAGDKVGTVYTPTEPAARCAERTALPPSQVGRKCRSLVAIGSRGAGGAQEPAERASPSCRAP